MESHYRGDEACTKYMSMPRTGYIRDGFDKLLADKYPKGVSRHQMRVGPTPAVRRSRVGPTQACRLGPA